MPLQLKQIQPRKRFIHCVLVFVALSVFSSRADIVTDWNSLLLNAIRNESTAPPLAARNMAIVHTAIYDAVNAISGGHQAYHFHDVASPNTSAEAAALAAAHQTLVNLYPSQRGVFDSSFAAQFASIASGPARDNGIALGQAAASRILTWRSTDGASTTVPYIPRDQPGDWRRTPPFYRPPDLPQWPHVTPFAMTSGSQFRPSGPPALNSARYAADFNQVKALGALNSATRTPEQTQIARFWSDFSYTVTPPGHWNQIAQNIAVSQGNTLEENARLFALMNIAMADAGIASWDAKYEFNFWRPVTAIQAGDTDGNADTVADPNWTPLLNTPPFPEYISGHSTFSAAGATILAGFYGTDQLHFTIGSDALPGVFRSYESVTEAADEIGMSRIYGGIHFLSADLDGLATGQAIGQYVFHNYLVAVPEPSITIVLGIGATALVFIRRRKAQKPTKV